MFNLQAKRLLMSTTFPVYCQLIQLLIQTYFNVSLAWQGATAVISLISMTVWGHCHHSGGHDT